MNWTEFRVIVKSVDLLNIQKRYGTLDLRNETK